MFGFTVLNTSVLILLSSLILPILIYLFTKKKPQKIIFSSIRYIKESVQQRKRKINLKNILLLLIRLMILFFTIMGLSRPVIRTKKGYFSSNHPKTAIAIIIDNSYSMDYLLDTETELDKSKMIVKEINSILNNDDITILITRDDKWNKINSNIVYGKLPENIIDKISITPKAISMKSAIELANKYLIQSQYLNKEIYVITDYQKEDYPTKNSIPIVIIQTSKMKFKKNLAVTETHIYADFTGDKNKKKIYFKVKNFSNNKLNDIICKLILDDRTVAEKVISFLPFQEKTEEFEVMVAKEGWHSGYIKVKNERLEYDNKNYFTFFLKRNPKVAIISDDREFPISLVSILQIYTNDVKVLTVEDINKTILNEFDNVILYNISINDKILNSIEDNKSLFIVSNEYIEKNKNIYLKLFGIKIDSLYNNKQDIIIDQVNPYNSITKIFTKVKKSKVNYFYKLKNNNSEILLSAQKNPLALINEHGDIIWLFSLDMDNPFMVSSMFPAFAYNSLIATSKFYQENKNVKVGDKIKILKNKVILPDGKIVYVKNNIIIAALPGIYSSFNKMTAVNLDFSESDFRKNKIVKSETFLVTNNNWKNYIFKNNYGKEIWKYFFIIALLLFILEMILIKKEERR